MEWLLILLGTLGSALPCSAGLTLEDIAPKFATNMPIVWQAPTNHLPKQFWMYKRLPQSFSAAAISNAIVLGGFEKKGFPKPSKKDVILWADHPMGEPRPPSLAILPKFGQISFSLGDRAPNPPRDISRDEAAVERAWKCATLLGADPEEFAPTNASSVGKYGIFLARQVDGVRFPDDTQGFQIQFGTDGSVRQFLLNWPGLERERSCLTASMSEIVSCIRGHRAAVRPVDGETNYFGRIKALAGAHKLTIVELRAYYMDGLFGENPPENEQPTEVMPIGELQCVADFGTNSTHVQIYTPMVSAEVRRLLGGSRR
jgi:hypothetical protein